MITTQMRKRYIQALDFRNLSQGLSGRRGIADMDGVIEINDHFLMFEWKDIGTGESVSVGQLRMLKSLSKEPNKWIYILYGDTKTTTPVEAQ